MEILTLLSALVLAAITEAQLVAGPDSDDGLPSVLCNKTFADANATGIFSFSPGVVQGEQDGQPDNVGNYALDAQWGVTVYENIGAPNATIELSGWYNTNGANYSDDASLWYDVCIVTMDTLKRNTFYRAANDDGDCLDTFDLDCVNALKEQTAGFAFELVSNPTPQPGSNLTQGSLPRVCYQLGNILQENFPPQCNKYFNGSISAYGGALTSHNNSWLYDGCSITNEEDDSTFHHAIDISLFTSTYSSEAQKLIYANFTQVVIPVLTVFLPIADIEAQTTITNARAALSCPHVNHINEGSLQPYAPPSPTPVGGGGSLSGGAIAGIVVGVLVGVGVVLGVLWFFWFRKRRAGNKSLGEEHPPPAYSADAKVIEAPYGNEQTMPLTELSGQDSQIRPELPTQKSAPRVELAGDTMQHKGVGGPPAELPTSPK